MESNGPNGNDRDRRLLALIEEALRLPAAAREALVRKRCGKDEELCASVLKTLSDYDDSDYDDSDSADIRCHETVEPASSEQDEVTSSSRWEGFLTQLEARGPGHTRYTFRGEIARGGMGVILRVFDQDVRRPLAMKVILGAGPSASTGQTPQVDDQTLGRFLEEAQITGQLDHPGVVPVHDVGLDSDGQVYFTMKLVKGRTLTEVIEQAHAGDDGWSVSRVLMLLQRVTDAMSYAHEKGVIHRDLKPANIMVGRFGEVYVMDWGLARTRGREGVPEEPKLDGADPSVLTHRRDERESDPTTPVATLDGTVVGTPAYMSPEQARGDQAKIDARTDIYSLGAIIYHILSGQAPYAEVGRDPVVVLARLLEGPPRPVTEVAVDLSPALASICTRAMDRDQRSRYGSMAELAEDLRAYQEDRVVHAERMNLVAHVRSLLRRHPGITATVVLGLVALAILGAYSLREIRAEQRRTQRMYYIANIGAAGRNLDLKNAPQARDQLEACDPEFRGFEWDHLKLATDSSIACFPLPDGFRASGAFAVHPTSPIVAFGLTAGGVLLFDWDRGAVVDQHDNDFRAFDLAFSPDGRFLAMAGESVQVRDLETGELRVVSEMSARGVAVTDSAESVYWREGGPGDSFPHRENADGESSPFCVVHQASSEGVREVGAFEASWPISLVVSADGRTLLVSGRDGVHAMRTPDQSLRRVQGMSAPASLFADGRILTCDEESKLLVELTSGESGWEVGRTFSMGSGGKYMVRCGSFGAGVRAMFPHDDHILVRSHTGFARDLESDGLAKMAEQVLFGHTGKIVGAASSADGVIQITTSKDGTLRVWSGGVSPARAVVSDLHSQMTVGNIIRSSNAALVWFETNDLLITGTESALMRWDVRSMVRTGIRWGGDGGDLPWVSFGGLAAAKREDSLLLYRDPLGRPDVDLPGVEETESLAMSPSRMRIAVACPKQGGGVDLLVFDGSTNDVRRVELPVDDVGMLAFLSEDELVVPVRGELALRVVLEKDVRLEELTGEGWFGTTHVISSRDALWMVGVTANGLWVRSRKKPDHPVYLRSRNEQARALDVSVAGRVAIGSDDGTIRIWDGETGECVSTLVGHESRVRRLSFSPDGKRLASASNEVILWESVRAVALRRARLLGSRPRTIDQVERALEKLVFTEDLRADSTWWGSPVLDDDREVMASLAELTSWAPDTEFDRAFLFLNVPRYADLDRAIEAARRLTESERSREEDEAAARAVVLAHRHFPLPAIKVLLALAQYRLGRFELAIGRLEEATRTVSRGVLNGEVAWARVKPGKTIFRDELDGYMFPLSRVLEAMVRHRMGQHERARSLLQECPKSEDGLYPEALGILLREAESLINP